MKPDGYEICPACKGEWNPSYGPGPHYADCVDKLSGDRKILLDALRKVVETMESSRAHSCKGWDCATCYPAGVSDIAKSAMGKVGEESE